jgi:hypothetical protein
LTDAAKRYFLDEREDQRASLRKGFALTPKLLAAVWRDWGGSPPGDNIARSYLKLDRKLNEQSARSFLGIYKDNLAFADLKGSAMPEVEVANPMTDTSTLERGRDDSPPVPPPPSPPPPSPMPPVGGAPKVSLDGDQLTIAASIPLSELPTLLKKLKALEAFYKAG